MSAEPPNPTAGPQPDPTPTPSRALAERIVADAALSALAARWVPLSATTPDGPLDAVTRIAGTAALVLLGPPGSGKTTALQVAWHRLARAGLSRAVAPLYIDLAHARDGEGLPDLITRALDALGAGDTGLTPTHILLDNLDRMRHGYLFDDLRLVIDAGGRVGPAAVMACRTDDWAEIRPRLPGVTESHLQPAAPEVVRDALVRFLPAATAEAAAAWLDEDAALAQAVRQPRALGALIDVAAGRPPADWHVALFAEALLGRILVGVPSASRALHRAALTDVALSAQGRAFIPQVDTMAMRLGVTRYDMLHTGAVVPRGADVEFTEPLLARHCAALALVERFGQMPEALVSQLQAVDDPAVAPLLVHAYALTPDPDRFLAALRRLPAAAPIIAACLGLDAPHDFDAPASEREAASSADGAEDGASGADVAEDGASGADAAASLRHAWDITHSADVAYALAEVEADRGALAGAVQALRWAIDARPDVAAWHDALGQVEAERGRWIEAGEAFAAAHRLAPDDPAIARRLGRARVALGDTAGAIALLERGLAAAPSDAAAWSLLARAHEAAGATDAALRALAEALRLDDAWPDDLLLLARLTCDRELARPGTADLDAARSALARAAGRAPAAALRTSRDRLDWLMAERPRSEKPATTTGDGPASTDRIAPPDGSAGDPAADRMAAGVPPSDAPPAAAERPMPSVADVTRIAAQFAAGSNAFAPSPVASPVASPAAVQSDTSESQSPDHDDHAHDAERVDPAAHVDHDAPVDRTDDAVVGWLSLDVGATPSEPSAEERASGDGPATAPAPVPTPSVSGPPAFVRSTPPAQAWPTIAAADDAAHEGSWPGSPTRTDAEPSPATVAVAPLPAADDASVAAVAAQAQSIAQGPAPAPAPFRPPMIAVSSEASAVTQTAALLSVAGLYEESGHPAAAYVVIRRAQDDLPPSAGLARRAGELALALGDAASAVQQLSMAVALDAEDTPTMCALAAAHTRLGQHDAALAALRAAAERSPGDADLWLATARAADAAGDEPSAADALARAAKAAPDRPDVHAAGAASAMARGDVDAARAAYERAATHDPSDPRLVLPLVDLCIDDAPDRAIALLEPLPPQADVLTRRARLYGRRGDWPAAVDALAAARALPSGAENLDLAILHAQALLNADRPGDAAAALEATAPRLSPRPAPVDAVLGTAYLAIGRDRDALVALSAAAAAGALDAPSLVAYSRLACRLGAHDEAIRAAEAALVSDGALPAAPAAHADALAAAGRLEAAAHAAKAALDLAPDLPEAYLRLARLAGAIGRGDAGIAALEAGAARLPDAAALHHALGRARTAAGDAAAARASFASAAALAPHDADVQRDLAASLAVEDPSGALDALERVVVAAPSDPEAFRAKAGLEATAGDGAAARASLRRASELAPDRPDLHVAHGLACLAQGDLIAAASALDDAHRLAPHDPDVHAARGALHEAAGRLPAALDSYETAARLAPRRAAAWSAVGRLRLDRDDVAGALTALAEAVRLDDGDAATHRALAIALERVEQPADAARHWDRARRLAPEDPNALIGLGRARLEAGDAHGAVAVLHQALPALEGSAPLHAVLAQALLAAQRLEEARTHADRATTLDPRAAEAWRAAAMIHRAAGDLAAARDAQANTARLAPSIDALVSLAELDDRLDDPAAASASWRRVLEVDPEHAHAALRFGQCVAAKGWRLDLAIPAPAPAIDAPDAAYAETMLLRGRARLDGADAAAAERALAVVRGRAGQVGAALEAARAAVAIDASADSLLVRAWTQLADGDPAAALADVRLATARGEDGARLHALAARANAAAGDAEAAAESLMAAIDRAPAEAELPCLLAELQLASGDRSAAAATLRSASAIATDEPTERRLATLALAAGAPEIACSVLEARAAANASDPAPLPLLAEARRRIGDMPGARETLERAVHYAPDRPDMQAQLGDLLAELDDLDGARVRYGRAIALQPYHAPWRLADAAALERLGRRDEARAALVDALTFAPKAVEVRLRLAALHLEDGAAKAAHDVLEPMRAATPDDARVHHQLGLAARAMGNVDAAAAAFDTAARLAPTDPRPFVALGDLHRSQGELDDAIQAYEQAVAIAPRSADTYLRLAGACRQAGMVERALLIHEQAVDLAPDDAAPRLAFGRLLAELGQFARAVEILDPTLGLMVDGDPRLAETLNLIASLYARLDQHERARPYLEQAHALQPNEPSGKRLRANQFVSLFSRSRTRHANGAPRDGAN